MSKRNPLRNSTRKNTNYKLYKAKKQWVTACATFLLTFGATAVFNSANAQTVNNNKRSNNEIEEVTSATGSSSTNGPVELSATSAADQSDTASVTSQADTNSSNASADNKDNVASTTDETSSADDAHHTDTAVASPADSGTQSDENATNSVNAVDASTASDATDASTSSTEEPNDDDAITTLKTNANGAVDVNSDVLKGSKINTTNTTVTWTNHRYIMDWDGQAHPASYWDERVTKEVLPWILKENNNEGATFKNITWTSFMNSDGNGNYIPVMNEGPANNRFGYAHGNLVVTNPNGTSTTTYNDVIINMARSIASYFRSKYGIDDNNNTEQKPVDDENAAKTVINVHANSNSFTGTVPNSSIGTITVGGWEYGQSGDNSNDSRDYFLSLIKEIKLNDANLSKDGTTNAKFAITFIDGSVLSGNKGTINVIGGVAQSGLNVGKGVNMSFAYPNATSGITTDSQNKIAQWTPTYDWVFDANGTPLDASHQYNTNANFDAYVKITYYLNGKNDGSQIVKVPITVNQTTIANSDLGRELVAHIDHFISHPISSGTQGDSTSSSWSQDKDPAGNPNLNGYSWGMDPVQIVWKSGTTADQKAKYKNIMRSLICTSEHSFPESKKEGTFSDSTSSDYTVKPGVTLFFTDGSSTTNIPDNYAWIYKPVQVTDSTIQNTFKTGDLSQFNSDSAKSHVTNVAPKGDSSNWSFGTSYQWVVKDPNGTYTFNDAVDMRNTDEWIVWQNGHWAVANPSNSQGKQGVTITGFRALTKDDIKDAGKKKFYVLIGYTKNAKSGSEPGTYDGYYGIPQEIDVTLRGKVDVAKISGDGKQTVDYKGAAYDASNLDLSKFVPTITDVNSNSQIPDKTLTPTTGNELTTADYEIKGDPTNVGSYDVYLKTSGIDKIKQWTNADLYDWTGTEADVKVGTFTIDPAPVTISLDGSSTEGYKGVGYNKPDVKKLLQTSDTAIDLSSLSSSDFSWYASPTDTDPIKVQTKPFNVGTYYLKLNATALAALQKNYPNYKLSFGKNNLYTFTVKPAIFTPNSMTGDYTITYGDAPEFSNQYKVGFKTDPLEVFGFTNPYTMGTAPAKYFQFKKQGTTDDWSTDKKFPTDAGTYDVTLSQDGWNALKDAKQYQNENVKLDVTDPTKLASTATFTIKAMQIQIML